MPGCYDRQAASGHLQRLRLVSYRRTGSGQRRAQASQPCALRRLGRPQALARTGALGAPVAHLLESVGHRRSQQRPELVAPRRIEHGSEILAMQARSDSVMDNNKRAVRAVKLIQRSRHRASTRACSADKHAHIRVAVESCRRRHGAAVAGRSENRNSGNPRIRKKCVHTPAQHGDAATDVQMLLGHHAAQPRTAAGRRDKRNEPSHAANTAQHRQRIIR